MTYRFNNEFIKAIGVREEIESEIRVKNQKK